MFPVDLTRNKFTNLYAYYPVFKNLSYEKSTCLFQNGAECILFWRLNRFHKGEEAINNFELLTKRIWLGMLMKTPIPMLI